MSLSPQPNTSLSAGADKPSYALPFDYSHGKRAKDRRQAMPEAGRPKAGCMAGVCQTHPNPAWLWLFR